MKQHRGSLVVALSISMLSVGVAQPDSRLAAIASQQEKKAAQAQPDEVGKIENALIPFQNRDLLERFSAGAGGFHLKLGGMGAGTAFGIGPEYRQTGFHGQLTFRATAQTSFRGDRRFKMNIAEPKISSGRYFAELNAVHRAYSRLNYYGSGPDSEKTGRTDFRLEGISNVPS